MYLECDVINGKKDFAEGTQDVFNVFAQSTQLIADWHTNRCAVNIPVNLAFTKNKTFVNLTDCLTITWQPTLCTLYSTAAGQKGFRNVT